jgi:hypothetical protein
MPLFSAYGVITAAMIFMAAVAALFVLPSLLLLTHRGSPHGHSKPERSESAESQIPK